jgi:hypothetical protein
MCKSADILFTNTDEARALCGFNDDSSPEQAIKHLSQYCPLVSVTDGARGSYLALGGEIVYIPPAPCVPVDTCGAGDAYAGGILYGLLRGVTDLEGIGNLAARVAAAVVGQQGTRLREESANEIAESVKSTSLPRDNPILELLGLQGEVHVEKISNVWAGEMWRQEEITMGKDPLVETFDDFLGGYYHQLEQTLGQPLNSQTFDDFVGG